VSKGFFYALGAYLTWGFFPIYFKALHEIPALQIIGHRVVWSFLFFILLATVTKELRAIRLALKIRRTVIVYMISALLLGANWLIYVYGVNSGFIVETSLGYFINPLFNVLLGIIFFRERLRTWQWVAVGLGAVGVVYLTISYGKLPWIALGLAVSFGLYGYVKKIAPLSSVQGLTLETGILFLPALAYLLVTQGSGEGAFGQVSWGVTLLMAGSGVITAIPLILFSSAAQLIPLSMLGLIQYVAPVCQFLIGVLIYNEPFTQARLVGFSAIWVALAILVGEGFLRRRGAQTASVKS